jgi:hypothetical protein
MTCVPSRLEVLVFYCFQLVFFSQASCQGEPIPYPKLSSHCDTQEGFHAIFEVEKQDKEVQDMSSCTEFVQYRAES